jgi:hypothetical protein
MQSFSAILSFAERFERGSSNQGCLLFRENFSIEVVLNCSFRASSAFKVFEAGLRSLELFLSGQQRLQGIRGRASVSRIASSGQQRLQDIRGGTSVPRIVSFGPAAPSRYSRQGFGPLNCFFRASSAFKIFEVGLRSFELPFLAQ